MNIFFLSYIPVLCAQMHGDLHLIKMILETTQMLCTNYRWLYGQRPQIKNNKTKNKSYDEPIFNEPKTIFDDSWIARCEKECGKSPYRMTHYNHGSTVWARQRLANFLWLVHLGLELCKEKRVRLPNKPPHVCEPLLNWFLHNLPDRSLFPEDNSLIISVPYIAIADFWYCKEESINFNKDPYQNVLDCYHKYYKYKEALNIVYYRWNPDRYPEFLKTIPSPTPIRVAILKLHLNKK